MNTLTLMEIKDRTWNIQACSAVTKDGTIIWFNNCTIGLQEGMEWLVKTISEKK